MKCTPRQSIVFALVAGFLAGCGQDPPEGPVVADVPSAEVSIPESPQESGPAGTSLVAAPAPYQQVSSDSNDCNLESMAGQSIELAPIEVLRGNSIEIRGWYIDAAAGTNGDPLQIVVEAQDLSGRWTSAVNQRSDRADVDEAKNGGGKFSVSGVAASLDMTALSTGSYGIYFAGSAGLCSVGRVFTLK